MASPIFGDSSTAVEAPPLLRPLCDEDWQHRLAYLLECKAWLENCCVMVTQQPCNE